MPSLSCTYGWKRLPIGAIKIGSKYYKAFTDDNKDKKDFYSALATCNDKHGTLIEFRDQSEAFALEVMRREYLLFKLQANIMICDYILYHQLLR